MKLLGLKTSNSESTINDGLLSPQLTLMSYKDKRKGQVCPRHRINIIISALKDK